MQPERLPDIYLFNPTCEYAVANNHISWQPNELLQKMEEDLTVLPLFLAGSDDIVLVKKIPSENFKESLRMQGIKLPGFVLVTEAVNNEYFKDQPLGRLLPWGWSPAIHHLLEPVKKSCSVEFHKSPVSRWNPALRELYSKKFALQILKTILPDLPSDIVMGMSSIPEVCTTRAEIENLLVRWKKIMIKAPWGSSGRGLQPVTKTPVVQKVWEKIMSIIKKQGYVIVEPLLDKQLDMALQFEIKRSKVSYLGATRFLTDKKGQYKGNFLNGWPDNHDQGIISFADALPEIIKDPLIRTIERSPLASHYEGFFGVDTIIFRDKKGKPRLNPCLEINIRQNMGLLSIHLEKLLNPGKKGVFNIYYQPEKSFFDFKSQMQVKHPLKLKNNRTESGFLALTDADEKSLFGGYILI